MDDKSFNIRVPKRWARVAMLVGVTALIVAPLTAIATHSFTDVPNSNTFHGDIAAIADAGVTKGCNPPDNTEYCPDDFVTRGQMAAFMNRLGALGAGKTPVVNAATAVEAGHADTADNATTADTAAEADLANAVAPGVVGSDELEDNEPFNLVGDSGQPSFQNSWSNFGTGWSEAGFFKDHQDVVYLKGTIDGGASGTTVFTLPAEYRPNQNLFLPVANGDFAFVLSNGNVQVTYDINTSNGDIGLDGLSFRIGTGGASAPSTETPGQ